MNRMVCPDLDFTIETAETLRFAASPHIVFKLRIANSAPRTIHTVILRCQIQLDVSRRRYTAEEQKRLTDLFGEPNRWGETLRPLLWTNTSVVVPSFDNSTVVDLPIPCTFDFNVAATKYFAGIETGEIPVSFFFNGTIFYEGEDSALQVAQISWEKEASHRMPIRIWREMMDAYYPNTAWLCLQRDAFERLYAYKVKRGIPTFDEALLQAIEPALEAKAR
jgi:Family of unknown function (DUF6084)